MKSPHSFAIPAIKMVMFLLLLQGITINISSAQTSADFETDSITTHTLLASSFINDDEGWIADDAGNLWHTDNAGQSWSPIATQKIFIKLDFTDVQRGYGITTDAAYKTVDGGNTWSALNLPGNVGSAICFFDNSTGIVSGKEVIYKTTDDGATWQTVSTGGVSFVDYYFLNASTGIAAAFDEDSYQCIWRTTDGGQNWSNVYKEENYFITSVWFTDENNGWAAGYYTRQGKGKLPIINHSKDGGLTWKNVYINLHPGDLKGQALIDIRFRNALEGIALATYSENVITSDGGATWHLTYDDEDLIPSYGIYKLLDSFNEIYLAGKNGYVTRWK
ncbi:MAG: hypothetical protein JST18_12250 [Bacteroidetes bacterium]|nr:hypothetical protein [Bacteroidota bacterium]